MQIRKYFVIFVLLGCVSMEIWKAIPGFDHYEVSDQGRIRTVPFTVVRSNGRPYTHPGKIITQTIERDGYYRVSLYVQKHAYVKKVHRLVYESFRNVPGEGMVVDHINNNCRDNRLENLQVISNAENLAKDSWRHRKQKDLPLGVSRSKDRRSYIALFRAHNQSFYLGSFATAEEAATVYQEAKDSYYRTGKPPVLKRVRNMPKDGFKVCPCCGLNLPLSDYYTTKKGQRQAKCKQCFRRSEYARRAAKKNEN